MNNRLIETERAIFAAGCFWGVEHYFQNVNGVLSTATGYIGGDKVHPSYQDVCSGKTGHAEAVEVIFDTSVISFENLAKQFFEIHNPALIKKDENGKRYQYRSAVFYVNQLQKQIVEHLVELLKQTGFEVETEITLAPVFYKAEEYHQNYYASKGKEDASYRYKQKFH